MTVVLELEPKLEEALRKKASAKGVVLDSYLLDVLAKDVEPTYEEVMAPLWKEFEESGMTEDELDDFMNEIRDEVWREKQAKTKR